MSTDRFDPEPVLRGWLARRSPRDVPSSLLATVERVTAAPPDRGLRARARLAPAFRRGVAAAAVVVLAAGGLYLGLSRVAGPAAPSATQTATASATARVALHTPTPEPSAPPSQSPTPPPPTPGPTPSVTQLGSGWRLVRGALPSPDQDAFYMGGYMIRVVGGQFIATAGTSDGSLAVFRSGDGVSWLSAGRLTAPRGTYVTAEAILQLNARVVVVGGIVDPGAAGSRPATWATSDFSSWTLATDHPGPNGAYAFAQTPGDVLAADWTILWQSPDGVAWTKLGETRTLFGAGVVIEKLFSVPTGYVAIGEDPDGRTIVWHSADLRSWTETYRGAALDPKTRLVPAMGPVLRATDGSYGSYGWISQAPGGCASCPKVVYSSNDGAHWTRSAQFDGPGAPGMSVAGGAGYFTAGFAGLEEKTLGEGIARVWTSSDLRHWTEALNLESFGKVQVDGIVSDGSRVILYVHTQSNEWILATRG